MRDDYNVIEPLGIESVFVPPNLYDITTRKYNEYLDLSEFIQWGRRNPSRFCEEIFDVKLLDYQRYCFDMSWTRPFIVWAMSRNGGKALALNTPIPTPDGKYITMGQIKVGHYVIGDDLKPTKVISTSDVFYNHKCYEILFEDGEVIVSDEEHIWSVYDLSVVETDREIYDLLTKDIVNNIKKGKVYAVPIAGSACDPSKYKTIRSINKVESVPTKCIYVDNKSHRYLCGKNNTVTHNSILASLFIMTKMLLIPNFTAYILAGVGSQSIEMFSKMEQFALKQIPSFTDLNDIFQSNVLKSQSNSNGWVHNPASYKVQTYGGARCFTLNGSYDNNRSKRSNLNVYDEASFASDELFNTSEPFTTQNSSFKAGKNYNADDLLAEPTPFPNQLLYCSSAGRTDQYFFKKYKEFSLKMLAGDRRYFCADISSDVVIGATEHGKIWPVPLLTQEKVDQAMRVDKEAALREYKNIFTSEGGDGQIIKRATIIRNSVFRPPMLYNVDSTRKFALLYDPARSKDNSVVLCAEYYKDSAVGWKMKIQNVVNLLNILKKSKTPMTTPNQIKAVKQLLLDYNGKEVADYENILGIWIDAGAGGAGVNISDFFWEDWEDSDGNVHRGLIDAEYSPEEVRLYPNAIKNKMRLLQPSKYKVEMYRALIEMMDMNLIEWPAEYDNRGYIPVMYEYNVNTGEKIMRFSEPTEKEVKELSKVGIEIIHEQYKLDSDEEVALKQIDLMKTELVNMYRFKQSSGGDRFDLAPDKAEKMHDDRAYVAAMGAYLLQQLRRDHLVNKTRVKSSDLIDKFKVTQGKRINKLIG